MVTHECIIVIQPCLGCINWFVAQYIHKYKVSADQCVVISATTGQYHDIALATGQYRIYTHARRFDLRHRLATNIGVLMTDRHTQISKWTRENLSSTDHHYDAWHLAKSK